MTLLQVCAASLVFSDTSTMTQRLRSTISTIVDTPETLFQQIPFCQTSQSLKTTKRRREDLITGKRKCECKSKEKEHVETIAEKLVRVTAPQTPAKPWGGEVTRSLLFNKTREEEMVAPDGGMIK